MLRLKHKETICIDQREEIGRSSLDLEVVYSCGNVFLPDILRLNKGSVILYRVEIVFVSVLAVPGDSRNTLFGRKGSVLDRDSLVPCLVYIMLSSSRAIRYAKSIYEDFKLFGMLYLL